ncbi:Hypothetical predicted protein [Lecanosticta acicola]|uniref:Uncharacterized protein n=1 Tax=Lecanosticta acicola TaxID=111012 RepID=A0AAI8YY13_9PEZI|nr:Hypothetical predicted protein [Lecanosticta acicola]
MGRPKKRSPTDDGLKVGLPNKRQIGVDSTITGNAVNTYGFGDAFEGALTPGGNLQPWLQTDWTEFGGDSETVGPPALTPDHSSTHSPPNLLNRPPELQRDNSTHMLLDPALGGTTTQDLPCGLLPNCACLSTMYLALNNLQTLTENRFPYALHTLREAMQTASTVLTCEECPKRFMTAIHNVHIMGTLLMSITEGFSKTLHSITTETRRAGEAGEKKQFRLADSNTSTSHLHTGGLGCVAAFSVKLTPEEWKRMCKKVVRAEVHGPEDGNGCCVYLMGVLKQMEERQHEWHQQPVPEDFPRDFSEQGKGAPLGRSVKKEDHVCLKLVAYSKRMAEGFDWS